MFKLTEKKNALALSQLEALANKVAEAMADEGALVLYEKLDASTSARTGEKYAGLPRRSSTPTQMPQEQSGDLQQMVDSKPLGPSQYGFGLYPKTAEELAQAKAMETGAPRANVMARQPVRRTAYDSRTHARMIARGKRRCDTTLSYFLRHVRARPTDPTSPLLCVAEGFLSKDDEARVTSPEYDGLPYCYLLNVGDAEIVRYHSGKARYLNPVDVVFEARSEDSKPHLEQLYNGVKNSVWQVDEITTSVPLATRFRVVGGYRPESRRPGFWETMLRLESSSL